jgi:hypothetical protein
MLLKAAILHRGGSIREKGDQVTFGFGKCVRCGLSDGAVKFLSDDQALTLQTINGLRDAAQHHLLSVSEQQLYIHCQSGITLFRDLLREIFGQELSDHMPDRVLPISTAAPTDIVALFDNEVEEIARLLKPGRRRRADAYARLRPLAILDAAVAGDTYQPSVSELAKKATDLMAGKAWQDIFPGAAAIVFNEEGVGPNLSLRLTKREGIPVRLVPEGTDGAAVVGVKRVNELDYYNLGRDQVAEHMGLSTSRTTAAIWYLRLHQDGDCFKEIAMGKSRYKRYSQQAIARIKEGLREHTIEEIWQEYSAHIRDKK